MGPRIPVVVAATRGDQDAHDILTPYLDDLAGSDDWHLAAAIRRILNGETDRDTLTSGLDTIDTTIVTAVLDQPDTTRQDDG